MCNLPHGSCKDLLWQVDNVCTRAPCELTMLEQSKAQGNTLTFRDALVQEELADSVGKVVAVVCKQVIGCYCKPWAVYRCHIHAL